MGAWASELDHGARRWPGLMTHVFFYMMCMAEGVTYLRNTRMHYGKKVNQWKQCDTLGNSPAGKPWVLLSCGCYCDTFQWPKSCCRPCPPVSWKRYFLMAVAAFSNAPKQKWSRRGLRSTATFEQKEDTILGRWSWCSAWWVYVVTHGEFHPSSESKMANICRQVGIFHANFRTTVRIY